ncbi:quinolinate synthetase [Desulfonispora thiosulfatigenes DSM 11270]|uniref:Quinolinate synthase n=1 Tax=Desulfonispora thiosulfatigenes DSM 11270 TaxID=656914 RepID=A0A1W1VGL8_DESTI|nr:quinolinate synthase NadA [Desulfonispora thiosulfatigenes]SMB92370.1 quinolinate synthetase [Desulfonispora thiosulfatigenes DSM 11270]
MKDKQELKNAINKLKKDKNAIILAHNYQIEEVQDIADFIGDSYDLSRQAASSNADIIVFCGVHFMAETANILSPNKIVILPDKEAGCPMADTIKASDVRKMRSKYPDAAVVCYINTSAAVKAECEACCTSANAVKIVNSLPQEKIIFLPDKNLGNYVKENTAKEIILWDGCCHIHDRTTIEELRKVQAKYPDAPIVVHPECNSEVVNEADFVGGTNAMMSYVKESNMKRFIIGTEVGMLYPLKNQSPEKDFIILTDRFICPDMKLITLEKIYDSLKNLQPQIIVPPEIAKKALKAVNKMLEV